jgi:hypothetical protein
MNPTLCDITPCSPLKVKRRIGGTCRVHFQGRRINQASAASCWFSFLTYSATLKMEATHSAETSVGFQRITSRRQVSSKPPLWELQILQSVGTHNLKLGNTQMWAVSFMARLLYSWEQSSRHPFNRRLGGHQSRWRIGKFKPIAGITPSLHICASNKGRTIA